MGQRRAWSVSGNQSPCSHPTQVASPYSAPGLRHQRPFSDLFHSGRVQILGPFSPAHHPAMLAFTKRPREGLSSAKALLVALAQGVAAGEGGRQPASRAHTSYRHLYRTSVSVSVNLEGISLSIHIILRILGGKKIHRCIPEPESSGCAAAPLLGLLASDCSLLFISLLALSHSFHFVGRSGK